jgi:tetratricopeptide (TPR) repeat protein
MNAGRPVEAVAAYRRAASVDDFPESWLGLAMAQLETGDRDGARASLERAMRIGRRYPTVAIAAGQLYGRIGDEAAAKDAYVDALVLVPSLFGDPNLGTLVQPLTVEELRSASAARLTGSAGAVQLALELDRRADAESAAQSLGAGDRALFTLVVPAWFRDQSAGDQLTALARRQPQNLAYQDWAGLVAGHTGSPSEAARYRRIADIDLYPFSTIGAETRLAPPGDARAGGDISIYGAFLYRRPTPTNMLPVSLWGLRNE